MFDTDTIVKADHEESRIGSRKVLGKWRNAISITHDEETGEVKLHRFDKRDGRWIQLAYFATPEDFDEFIDFCDEKCPEVEDED